jgi:prophage antirepressor-like protein
MNSLIIEYESEGRVSDIRTLKEGKNVYFSLEDVVKTLAADNSAASSNIKKHGLSELVSATLSVLDHDEVTHKKLPNGENRVEAFVTEPGLYRIVLRDSSPAAKKFQRWVIHEVLPAIRQFGIYPAPSQEGSELRLLAQRLVDNTNLLIREIDERERLEKEMNDRFSQNELVLNELSLKLEEVTDSNRSKYEFESIRSVAEDSGLRQDQAILLWAHCAKICVEEQYPSIKPMQNDQLSHCFPKEVIEAAFKFVKAG